MNNITKNFNKIFRNIIYAKNMSTIKYHVSTFSELNNDLNSYFKNSTSFEKLKVNLSNKESNDDFKETTKDDLKEYFSNLTYSEFDNLYGLVNDNLSLIKNNVNQNNYLKHKVFSTDLLSVYLIVWTENAITDIHYHASNGCHILKLSGEWREDIYKNNLKDIRFSRKLEGGNSVYIENTMGAHKVYFINDITEFGLSVNIYSPTCELEN